MEDSIQLFLRVPHRLSLSIVNLEQQLVGAPNSSRFPDYKNLNLALEKKFAFRGYLWAARILMVNAVNWQNPNVIANNVDAPISASFREASAEPSPRESASLAENSIRLTVGEAGRTKIRLIQTCGIPALSILVGVEMEAPPIVER
jgi:hypothetical protein